MQDKKKPLVFQDILEAYERKDPYVLQRVERIARELSVLIFNLGNFLGLHMVVFGGEYAVFGDMISTVYENRLKPRLCTGTGMSIAALGRYSGIHGMLFTARMAYFDSICT